MKYRKLGHGLEVSAIGIGCMPMIKGGNILYGEAADLGESTRTIHRAIAAAAPKGGTSGPRYGEQGMRMVRL